VSPCEIREKTLQGIRVLVKSVGERLKSLFVTSGQALELQVALVPIRGGSRRREYGNGFRHDLGATGCSYSSQRRGGVASNIACVIEKVLVEAAIIHFRLEPPDGP
jgi:hypothetical protein